MSDHAHGAAHDGGHSGEFHSHFKSYFSVFVALCLFTLVSYAADKIQGLFPNRNVMTAIVLGIALCKALCVMLIFMHLKFERAWKYLLLAPTFILAATIPFALTPDIGSSYYTPTAPQILEHEAQEAQKAADKASGHHKSGHGDSEKKGSHH
jgi:caa(3)-type oxidase subunit IV